MCMCGKPTINGESGYSWDDKVRGVYPINPPALADGDETVYDEPGRCGGLDSHSYHLRLVRDRFGYSLLIRHGGGDERIGLGLKRVSSATVGVLATLDSNARYWMMLNLYYIHRDAAKSAADACNARWRQAAAEKRIKTRKLKAGTKVWIEPQATAA